MYDINEREILMGQAMHTSNYYNALTIIGLANLSEIKLGKILGQSCDHLLLFYLSIYQKL